jgi:hypothetical protein
MSMILTRGLRAAILAGAATFIAGCSDREPTTPTVEGLNVREVILMASDGSVAYSHRDHWHGAPVVRAGQSVSIDMHFTSTQSDPDTHEAPPVESWFRLGTAPADYNLRVVVEDTTIARWTGDRERGTLTGLRAGASRLSIVVRRGTTTVLEAPPLNFRVQEALTTQ